MTRLDGKVAIITGGARGIGTVYAHALAGEGAKVVIVDILEGSGVAAKINAQHPDCALSVLADVSEEDAVADLVAETVRHFGRLDILINNAADLALGKQAPFDEISVEDWDRLMAVNLRGPFLCCRAAVPEMRKQQYGKIINICSSVVFNGPIGFLHYVSSKGGILAMTRSLSREVGDDGICVNSLAPGLTMSEAVAADKILGSEDQRQPQIMQRALKRDQQPDDLVGTLLFLASPDSDFITGQCMLVDGGSTNH